MQEEVYGLPIAYPHYIHPLTTLHRNQALPLTDNCLRRDDDFFKSKRIDLYSKTVIKLRLVIPSF